MLGNVKVRFSWILRHFFGGVLIKWCTNYDPLSLSGPLRVAIWPVSTSAYSSSWRLGTKEWCPWHLCSHLFGPRVKKAWHNQTKGKIPTYVQLNRPNVQRFLENWPQATCIQQLKLWSTILSFCESRVGRQASSSRSYGQQPQPPILFSSVSWPWPSLGLSLSLWEML